MRRRWAVFIAELPKRPIERGSAASRALTQRSTTAPMLTQARRAASTGGRPVGTGAWRPRKTTALPP